jgi:hypothetical protein
VLYGCLTVLGVTHACSSMFSLSCIHRVSCALYLSLLISVFDLDLRLFRCILLSISLCIVVPFVCSFIFYPFANQNTFPFLPLKPKWHFANARLSVAADVTAALDRHAPILHRIFLHYGARARVSDTLAWANTIRHGTVVYRSPTAGSITAPHPPT